MYITLCYWLLHGIFDTVSEVGIEMHVESIR